MRSFFVIIIFLFSMGQSYCLTIRAQHGTDPYYHTIPLGVPITIDIIMNNNDFERLGYSMPFRFYSTDNDISSITHINIPGGYGPSGSIELLNGFEDYWAFFNMWTGFGWDGNLPDTINHTTASLEGWPWGLGEKVYIKFHIQIDAIGEFCIDSVSIPNQDPPGKFDWIFEPTGSNNPFYGPYCWWVEEIHPVIDGQIKIKHSVNYQEEPMPRFEFDIMEIVDGTPVYVTTVTTNDSGIFCDTINYTENLLRFSFTSYQQSGSLFSFYDSTSGNDEPIVGTLNLGQTGSTDGSYDIKIYRWESQPDPLSPSDSSFDKVSHILRDIYTTDSIMSIYGFQINNIPIREIPSGERHWAIDPINGPVIHWTTSQWYNQRICHEIGHQIMYQLQNNTTAYPSGYNPSDSGYIPHTVTTISDTIFAFAEGWAHFIHAISTVPDTCGADPQSECYERNDWWMGGGSPYPYNEDGAIVEGAVASILFDIYDDDSTPSRRRYAEYDDDVRNDEYMMPIILACIGDYGNNPYEGQTRSINKFSWRMFVDSSQYWFDDEEFWDLSGAICDIFDFNHFTPSQTKGDYPCKGHEIDNQDIENESVNLPMIFSVGQNHPNPFNLSTEIRFTIPSAGDCQIQMYNIIGQKIWSRFLHGLEAGQHNVILSEDVFDGVASGIYFYKVIYKNQRISKKMILLK